jgi:hypothetical protein
MYFSGALSSEVNSHTWQCILPAARRRILGILIKAYFTLPMDRCLKWLLLETREELKALLTLVLGPNGDWCIAEDNLVVTFRVPKKKQ